MNEQLHLLFVLTLGDVCMDACARGNPRAHARVCLPLRTCGGARARTNLLINQ